MKVEGTSHEKEARETRLEKALLNIGKNCKYGFVAALLIMVATIVYDRTVPQPVVMILEPQTGNEFFVSPHNMAPDSLDGNQQPYVDNVATSETTAGVIYEEGANNTLAPDTQDKQETQQFDLASTKRVLTSSFEHRIYKHKLSSRHIKGNPDGLHFVFSTDCTDFMTWQTEVFAHHFFRYMPDIPLTRLISVEEGEECKNIDHLKDVHSRWPNLNLYSCPDARTGPSGKDNWRFYNKPYAVTHWLQHADLKESMIVLLDMDMIIFKPFTFDSLVKEMGWAKPPAKGNPAGMSFGYYVKEWAELPQCLRDKHCKELHDMSKSSIEGKNYVQSHYTPGPPYIIHKDDLLAVGETWYQTGYEVREHKKSLGEELGNNDEMFGFSISAAKLQLPFMQTPRLSLSATDGPVRDFEDWDAFEAGKFYPFAIHYCQYYKTENDGIFEDMAKQSMSLKGQFTQLVRFVKYDWGFSTTELDGFLAKPFNEAKFLSCETQELIDPTTGIRTAQERQTIHLVIPHIKENAYGKSDITLWDGHKDNFPDWRQLYVANILIANINAALIEWQSFFCDK